MKLLNILYNLFKQPKSEPLEDSLDEYQDTGIYITVDDNNQYLFRLTWDYTDIERSSDNLANLYIGITYGLFSSQIKNLLISDESRNNIHDEKILNRTLQLIDNKINIMHNLISNEEKEPIIKPLDVFKSNYANK
jgi:hypothetical protein